ncbi:SH3 domain-binding glutamic acid-rich-like protein 3 [Strongylocentrotus purpuratus]|uniref:SH3 domain-binding glutamic acid-rich-like protein 3 n=1 Tax=Strongylocentrotus purpuratus TaxID=7668 RepID=A0A7M7PIL4_STRPU|nr:SH3 domain-binding glutamic acid-rich-like protein 3 [Strongylocentrotus purpuratus]
MSAIVLYITSVNPSQETKKNHQKIKMILDRKKIKCEDIDIAQSTDAKQKMRDIVGDPKALPPQICNGETYCGDYAAFDNAVEAEDIESFLKLK